MSSHTSAGGDVIRHDVHDFLPVDGDGRLDRAELLKKFGIVGWDDRPAVTVFCASRKGDNPQYVEAARELSHWMASAEIGLVSGGAPDTVPARGAEPEKSLGLMSAVGDHNPHLIGVSPQKFADKNGYNSGISRRAINLVTYDFYTRKVSMDVLSHQFLGLPGGFGTIEEILEAMIYGAKNGKPTHLLSLDGFWNDLVSQFRVLRSLGLIREDGNRGIRDIGEYTSSTTVEMLCGHVERHFRDAARQLLVRPRSVKPGISLQAHLRANPHLVPERVLSFASDRPRIGMIVSGNISPDPGQSRLKDAALTKKFCEESARIGAEVARQGGVLVLSGGKYGLRQIMAEAAKAEGGSVIWVEKGSRLSQPLVISGFGQELTFTVSREFEKAMLFDFIAQSNGFLSGGINTMDRVFEIVTREQTGFGGIHSYLYMFGDDINAEVNHLCQATRTPVPTLGLNIGGMWNDMRRQVDVCHREGFIEKHHMPLFQMPDMNGTGLAAELVQIAKQSVEQSYDVLDVVNRCVPRRSDCLLIRSATPLGSLAH